MKQEVRDVLRICQGFYILFHLLGLMLFVSTSNPLCEISILPICFWTLKLCAAALFFFSGSNPGYLSISTLALSEDAQSKDWQVPEKNYCEICQQTQPYRTKHCNDCEDCVCKFDHHCFWLGSCVGELNHFKFVTYLVLESCCLFIAFLSCFHGEGLEAVLYAALALVTGGFSGLTGGLAVFHVYIISIGSTTWEIMRRKSISYLKPYPLNYHPFSRGFFANWKSAASTRKVTQWLLPRPQIIYPFNWCDNEYWSCC